MTGPSNTPLGDQGLDELPRTQVPEDTLRRERAMAQFSKTAEFSALKEAMESRIYFYQNYMPGTQDVKVAQLPNEERGYMWLAASVVIEEFRSILLAYEQANIAVSESDADR